MMHGRGGGGEEVVRETHAAWGWARKKMEGAKKCVED